MKTRNLIIQAAIAGVFGVTSLSAFAGVANGFPVPMATQAIVDNTTLIGTGSLAYSLQAPIPAGTAYLYVKLNNGAKFASAPLAGSLTFSNPGTGTFGAAPATLVPTLSTDGTYAIYTLTVTSALPVNLIFTFKPTTAVVSNALAAVAAGGLTGSMSLGSSSNLATVVSDLDTASTGTLLNLVPGLTFSSLQSGASTFVAAFAGAAVETKQINVASGTGVAMVDVTTSNTPANGTLINFGAFKFTNVAGVVGADATAAFNIATDYAASTYTGSTLTGNFAAAAGTGGKVFLSVSNACASVLSTGALSAGNTVATFGAGAAQATAVPVFVCMQVNTPANAIVIPATTPSLVATITGTAGLSNSFTGAAASLYALTTNGTAVNVKSYIPAGAAGYTSFIRVINTGTSTANISAAVISDTTGTIGTAGVIASSVAPGAAVTLTSAQIEAAIGAVTPTTSRPRLQISGPGAFTVQSFILTNANGNFSEVSGNE